VAIFVVLAAVVAALYLVGRNTGKNPSTPPATHATTPPKHRARHRSHRASAPAHVKLELIPTGQVYVCLVDGTGKKLIPGVIYSPGQTIPTKSATKLMLTLGNNAVQMKVNGAKVPVVASPGSIGYEFQGRAHHVLPAAQQPRCA
jgi:hypothetical protein